MPEAPTTEPWAGTPPVPASLRPGAKPEAYMAKIAEGDEKYWVPIVEDVSSKPVWISPSLNMSKLVPSSAIPLCVALLVFLAMEVFPFELVDMVQAAVMAMFGPLLFILGNRKSRAPSSPPSLTKV